MVDDDPELCEMVAKYLREDGFTVRTVHDGKSALQAVEDGTFDAMVLDVMMPGLSGHEVLRHLQQRSVGLLPMPILMLTARGDEVDRIVGLETGADDYLAKPCSLRELSARLRAILRRSARAGNDSSLSGRHLVVGNSVVGKLSLDTAIRAVSRDGVALQLTSAEFEILCLLMRSAGKAVSKEVLTNQALGREYIPYDRSIDVHIANLRKKLARNSATESVIRTIRGAGYLLIDAGVD